MNTENKFEWNDALIKEMIYQKAVIPEEYMANVQKMLEDFKKSKGFTPNVERDFEIQAYRLVDFPSNVFTRKLDWDDETIFLNSKSFEIHSVRRLSDSEIFTVGDVVDTVGYNGYPHKPIKRFFIGSYNVLYIQWDEGKGSNDGCMSINAIQKSTPKKILGTTHDGKVCYEGDTFALMAVAKDFSSWWLNVPSASWNPEYKYFADEEKAKEYILANKPIQVSYNELEFYLGLGQYVADIWKPNTLKDFFKSKINNP